HSFGVGREAPPGRRLPGIPGRRAPHDGSQPGRRAAGLDRQPGMIVKICGITNREDALAAIDGGAAALGFNFYPRSPRYVDPERAAELIAVAPAGVWKVGVFVNEAPERIVELAHRLRLDVVQLHGDEVRYPAGLRIWRAAAVDENFRLADLDQY